MACKKCNSVVNIGSTFCLYCGSPTGNTDKYAKYLTSILVAVENESDWGTSEQNAVDRASTSLNKSIQANK